MAPSDDGEVGGLQWQPQYAGAGAFALARGRASSAASSPAAASVPSSGGGPQAPPREDGSEDDSALPPASKSGSLKPPAPSISQLLPASDGSDGSAPSPAAAAGGGGGRSATASTAATSASNAAGLALRLSQVPSAFHAVVITCPAPQVRPRSPAPPAAGRYPSLAPQVLALGGDLPALLEGAGVAPALSRVAYSSRYSLALFYSPADWAAVAAALPFAGRFYTPMEDDV